MKNKRNVARLDFRFVLITGRLPAIITVWMVFSLNGMTRDDTGILGICNTPPTARVWRGAPRAQATTSGFLPAQE